jgi:hypothetical protein
MEFGEAVLFAKFLRKYGTARQRHAFATTKKKTPIEIVQKENPGLWFKWLAYRAATLQERRK